MLSYRSALSEADEIFDYHMEQMAMALRPGLPAVPADAPGPLVHEDESYEFVVQVWSSEGSRVFESAVGAALPQRAVLGFSKVKAHGTTYRVFSVQTRAQVIQVAQDMAVRKAMARDLALRTAGPIAFMALAGAGRVVGGERLARAGGARAPRGGAAPGGRPLARQRRCPAGRSAAAGGRA